MGGLRLVCSGGPPARSVTVVGGGAAGLTAAYFAAQQGAKVTVLERTRETGKKVLISGGARCNVLPMHLDLERDFFTESKLAHLKAVLRSWHLAGCKRWLEEDVGLALAEEADSSKWFPASNSSREVRDRLEAACRRQGVQVRCNASVEGIAPGKSGGWTATLAGGESHTANRLVMATGGLSFPKMGTDGTGLRLLRALGHGAVAPYPALTPLRGPHPSQEPLAGLSVQGASLSCRPPPGAEPGPKRKPLRAARGGFLFTHRGFSGPSILDLSHLLVRAQSRGQAAPEYSISWTGATAEEWDTTLRDPRHSAKQVASVLKQQGLPARLADALCAEAGVAQAGMASLRRGERAALVQLLAAYPLPCTGHEGYAKAEVTGGGVPLGEVDTVTLESRRLPGLHLCGELLDAFGRIGGFNFYWAWVSGRAAGLGALRS